MKIRTLLTAVVVTTTLAGCGGIPDDPGGAAPVTTINNITTIGATFEKAGENDNKVRINLLGILHPVTGEPIRFSANSNIWVTEDDVLKGIRITSASRSEDLRVDIVFVVDNSGSMGEESDSVASKIVSFVRHLDKSGLDVRVGCVGQDGRLNGALNLTSAANLQAYLIERDRRIRGVRRTFGFSGPDSAALLAAAYSRMFRASGVGGENSVLGITFADSTFSWRPDANRVYVIFTDEPTCVGRDAYWSAEGLLSRWSPEKGTIHTVFSEDTLRMRNWSSRYERPWELSRLTGGTMKFISRNAKDLDLTTLPVTNVLTNSVLIEFMSANPNVPHDVTITVKEGETADGVKKFVATRY
jgi:hypothetical protein